MTWRSAAEYTASVWRTTISRNAASFPRSTKSRSSWASDASFISPSKQPPSVKSDKVCRLRVLPCPRNACKATLRWLHRRVQPLAEVVDEFDVKTVLVMDDDVDLCELMTITLEAQGYRVLTSCNGRHGCELAAETLPDVILCDLLMPGMTGFEVVNRLRDNPHTARIPVAILSGEKHMRYHPAAPRCAAWIDKPFDISELVEITAQLVSCRCLSVAA
jgi:CheY-like chemotaxis protein